MRDYEDMIALTRWRCSTARQRSRSAAPCRIIGAPGAGCRLSTWSGSATRSSAAIDFTHANRETAPAMRE